jgi:Na+/H+ antiporter NhaC
MAKPIHRRVSTAEARAIMRANRMKRASAVQSQSTLNHHQQAQQRSNAMFNVLKFFAIAIIALVCLIVAAYTVFFVVPPMLTGGFVGLISGLLVAALSLIPSIMLVTLAWRKLTKKE